MTKIKNILSKFLILLIPLFSFLFSDPPNWDEDGDGVLDNYNQFENNGSITAAIIVESINYGDFGDMIACFVNGEQRGVGLSTMVPFGPYANTYQFQMMIYSNQTAGEFLTFQYYDSSEDLVYFIDETLEFTTNMVVGDIFDPYILTYQIDTSDDILGCTESSACNYNPEATSNDGSCEYPENNYDCEGECIVALDCAGICGGDTLIDICGECDGDNSTCTGCTDIDACNYDFEALVNVGCEYPEENYDCFGNCVANTDCFDVCGGTSIFDECGICDGQGILDGYCDCNNNILDCNDVCGGSAFVDNCNQCIDEEAGLFECESSVYELDLHYGSNLISFYSLPVDNSTDNILFNNDNDFIYSILGEVNSTFNSGSNNWQGSINNFEYEDGYWFRTINSMNLEIPNSYQIIDNVEYSLHSGNNLVSFPKQGIYDLETAIPDSLETYFDAIFGESLIAVRLDNGDWIGSLNNFEGGKGYWFVLNDDLEYHYNLSDDVQRNFVDKTVKPIMHNQSSIQSFYIINNIQELDIENGSWLLAYCNNQLSGSRIWDGVTNDIPVMGNDGSEYSETYCTENDQVLFKILTQSGDYIELDAIIPSFANMAINFIELTYSNFVLPNDITITSLYPNPFNPSVSIDFVLSRESQIDIQIIDINGKVVENLKTGFYYPGNYKAIWDAENYSSGIYFVNLVSDYNLITKKITLIK